MNLIIIPILIACIIFDTIFVFVLLFRINELEKRQNNISSSVVLNTKSTIQNREYLEILIDLIGKL